LILIELNLWHLKAGTEVLLDFAVPREVALRCTFWIRALFKVANRFVLADTGTVKASNFDIVLRKNNFFLEIFFR
jgi:hypothetical protein